MAIDGKAMVYVGTWITEDTTLWQSALWIWMWMNRPLWFKLWIHKTPGNLGGPGPAAAAHRRLGPRRRSRMPPAGLGGTMALGDRRNQAPPGLRQRHRAPAAAAAVPGRRRPPGPSLSQCRRRGRAVTTSAWVASHGHGGLSDWPRNLSDWGQHPSRWPGLG